MIGPHIVIYDRHMPIQFLINNIVFNIYIIYISIEPVINQNILTGTTTSVSRSMYYNYMKQKYVKYIATYL